eukprot:scpid53944/ scgid0497/ 
MAVRVDPWTRGASLGLVVLTLVAMATSQAAAEFTVSCARYPITPNCTFIGQDVVYVCTIRGGGHDLAVSYPRTPRFTSPQFDYRHSSRAAEGGEEVHFVFQNVSLANNKPEYCLGATSGNVQRRSCFKVSVCVPNILNCRHTGTAASENCTQAGKDAKFQCTARGPGLEVEVSHLGSSKARIHEVPDGLDITFVFPNISNSDHSQEYCFLATTTNEEQVYCFTLAVCTPKQWTYLPASVGVFSRSSIAKQDKIYVSYEDASSHCSTIGYYLATKKMISDWSALLQSEYTSIGKNSSGPYYVASSAAGPTVVSISAEGVATFTVADPAKHYRALCFVLCNNGFLDTSTSSAPVCRCLPGWLGKRCEKRAMASALGQTITLWLAPATAGCRPSDQTPKQCAGNGRAVWKDAQAACAAWSMDIARKVLMNSLAGMAFHRLATDLVVGGYHEQVTVWLNSSSDAKYLYSLGRQNLQPRFTMPNPVVVGNAASDVICEATWMFRWTGNAGQSRVALKSAPSLGSGSLWMVPMLCSAINMTIPTVVEGGDNHASLFTQALGKLGVEVPFFVPVKVNDGSIRIAKVRSSGRVGFLNPKPNEQYSPVCIRVCAMGQYVDSTNQCITHA